MELLSEPPYSCPQWLHQFIFSPTEHKSSLLSTLLSTLFIVVFLIIAIFVGMRYHLTVVLIYISLMLRYADDTTLMAESEEELKSLLMKVKEESEKVALKFNIQKMKIMASGPITSWEIDGETVETVADFILLGSKIAVDGDCNHEIKRHLLLGRKVMTNLDSIFKSRNITLPTNVCLVKALFFGAPKSLQMVTAAMKLKDAYSLEEKL